MDTNDNPNNLLDIDEDWDEPQTTPQVTSRLDGKHAQSAPSHLNNSVSDDVNVPFHETGRRDIPDISSDINDDFGSDIEDDNGDDGERYSRDFARQFDASVDELNDADEQAVDTSYDDSNAQSQSANAPRRQRTRDPRSEKAMSYLTQILEEMGMDVSVERRPPRPDSSPDEVHLEIVGHDVGRVIGKKGQVLSALQYLVNRVVNRPGLQRRHVLIDAEGYRYRRESSLTALAQRLAEQAANEGKIITFEPMSPRDRRVVHLALSKMTNVVTKSDGEGDERRVRIIPVRR